MLPSRDPFTICTLDCAARCCRYITVAIAPPLSRVDWDEFRWWLAHPGTMVTKGEEGWMLQVETRCRHLQPDNACGIYEHRPIACAEHDASACEFTDDIEYEVCLRSESDLADHLERRGLKRGAEIAASIRAAQGAEATP